MKASLSILCLFLFTFLTFESHAQFGRTMVKSPEVMNDNKVTFRIMAPQADTVKLYGNWMSGMIGKTMIKSDSGLWQITIGPLEPEMYTYRFMVDGVFALDPVNLNVKRDGRFRVENVVFIEGNDSDLYEIKPGPKGTVHQVWYDSRTLNQTRRMYVYTPPGYEDGEASYPVLYLLHGGGGDEDAWTTLGLAPTIADNLFREEKATPAIIVMTNGNPDQVSALNQAENLPESDVSPMASQMFEKSLVNDVIPYIESHYRVKTGKSNRAITGLSMGGLQTMNTTFIYPDKFDYIGVMSMGFIDPARFNMPVNPEKKIKQIEDLKKAKPKLYWIACGEDDFLYESVVTMRKELDKYEFPYIYRESAGGHTWPVWRIYLSEFLPMIFK